MSGRAHRRAPLTALGWDIERGEPLTHWIVSEAALHGHAAIVGGTGTGKSGFVFSTLLPWMTASPRHGSVVVDLKGETTEGLLAHFLPVLGRRYPHLAPDRVRVIAPFSRYGVPLGILAPIPGLSHPLQAYSVVNQLAELVGGDFGIRMEQIAATLIRAVLQVGGTVLDVVRLLKREDYRRHVAARLPPGELKHYLTDRFEREPQASRDALEARLDFLMLLPEVRAMLAAEDCIDADTLLAPGVTIIDLGTGVPHGMVKLARFIGAVLFQRLIAAIFRRNNDDPRNPPVRLVCDEWQEILRGIDVETFERILSLARSRNIALWLANQTKGQIRALSPMLLDSLNTNIKLHVHFRPSLEEAGQLARHLPVTGCRVDPELPDRLLSVAEERAALLSRLQNLPPRHALILNRWEGRAGLVRSLSVPYEKARRDSAALPANWREHYRRGAYGVPMVDLLAATEAREAALNRLAVATAPSPSVQRPSRPSPPRTASSKGAPARGATPPSASASAPPPAPSAAPASPPPAPPPGFPEGLMSDMEERPPRRRRGRNQPRPPLVLP
jgi:hypothetical protein